ncbi:MAG: hypothetical protein ACOYK9_04245 [Chlamydiia bacterium]
MSISSYTLPSLTGVLPKIYPVVTKIAKPLTILALAVFTIRFLASFLIDKLLSVTNNNLEDSLSLGEEEEDIEVNPFLKARIIDVRGDGNCFFHALRRCMQEFHDRDSLPTHSELRVMMARHLRRELHQNPEIIEMIKQDLSEIAEHKAQATESKLQDFRKRAEFKRVASDLARALAEPRARDSSAQIARKTSRFENLSSDFADPDAILIAPDNPEEMAQIEQTVGYLYDVSASLIDPPRFDSELTSVINTLVNEYADMITQDGEFIGKTGIDIMSRELGVTITIHGDDRLASILYSARVVDGPEIHLRKVGMHFKAMIYD